MIKLKQFFILAMLLATSVSAVAKTVYVSDNLRVGVRPEPDNAYTPVGVVSTGMKLEVLDSQQGFSKIRTEDGLTGWIKDIYLVEKPPAVITLQEIQKTHTSLTAKVKEMETTITSLEDTNSALNDQVDQLKEERTRLQELHDQSVSSQQQSESSWYWWLLAIIVGVSGAFIAGVQWNRQQAMKRLGGLRI